MSDYPQDQESTDLVVGSAKAVISMIPLAGAPLVEILNLLVTPTLQKRRDVWFTELGERLKAIEDAGFIRLEDLQSNDIFIDISLKATELALKTSEEEKLNALRNALLNSILDEEIDLSIKQIFLGYIDTLTVLHIKLLKLFNEPKIFENKIGNLSMGDTTYLIEGVYPELRSKKDIYKQVLNDLTNKGLMIGSGIGTTMSVHGILSKRTTAMGESFIKFISEEEL